MAVVGLAAIAASCASIPSRHIYVLGSIGDAIAMTDVGSDAPLLRLQPVLVPDYLDSTDIVLRAGTHQLQTSPTARWGERLSLAMTHALAADLAERLPLDRIVLSESGQKSIPQILADVDSFDVWPDGNCVLTATWSLLDQDGAMVNGARQTFRVTPAHGDPQGDVAIVAAMAAAVGQLADRIAAAVASRVR